MAPERRWDEFPYRLRSLLENIRNTAMPKTVSDIPHREKKIWSALVHAVDAIETSGFSSIDGLRKSLDGIENPYWWTRLTYVLEEWADNPDMPLAPVTAPAPAVKKAKRKKPVSPKYNAAPLYRSSADAVWLEFTGSSFYRETKTMIILNDPSTAHLASNMIDRNRHTAYVVSYASMRMLAPDRSISRLDEIPDNSCEPADVFVCGCEVFNHSRQIFSGIPEVHIVLELLKTKGLLGKSTKKLGLAYFRNNQYRRNYFRDSQLLFTADAMLTEVGDCIESYVDIDTWRSVIETEMELKKRRDVDGVSLF